MMKHTLYLLIVLASLLAGCSFMQEERTVLKMSADGKLVSATDDKYEPVEIAEPDEPDEPPEIEITNPMPVPEMSRPDMHLREMSLPEMPTRDN